jgi:hypothetical protein
VPDWQEAARASALESGAGGETWFEQGAATGRKTGVERGAHIRDCGPDRYGDWGREAALVWAAVGGVAELAGGIDYSAAGSRVEKELSILEI